MTKPSDSAHNKEKGGVWHRKSKFKRNLAELFQ